MSKVEHTRTATHLLQVLWADSNTCTGALTAGGSAADCGVGEGRREDSEGRQKGRRGGAGMEENGRGGRKKERSGGDGMEGGLEGTAKWMGGDWK